MLKRSLSVSCLILLGVAPASAQIITIRTVPISQAHQFQIFPSQMVAMGDISIAVADTLHDPFSNPATGSRLGTARFFGSPAVYSVSEDAGGGRTLPIGALMKTGRWYGGLAVALQEVDLSRAVEFAPVPFSCPSCPQGGIDFSPPERSHGNTYAFAMLGRDLPGTGISIGGSVLYAGLHAVDGVDLLYPGNARLKQYGHAIDLRFGLLKEWSGDRTLEAVLVHNQYTMTHDVFYLDLFWDPGTQQTTQRPRMERNLDRTRIWGLHLEYERPLSAPGWQIGFVGTVNRMSHPKIPNYEIMNIPRDPGNSSAFNVGVGVSRQYRSSTFGVDVIYEPIWSHTWADSDVPVETNGGEIIPPGGMTIENHFRFSNAVFRMGVGQDVKLGDNATVAGLQFGLSLRSIHYWLDQRDHVQLSSRDLEESWVEWTPTWGATLRFPELEFRYQGRVTNGTGRPGVGNGGPIAIPDVADVGSTILVAPSGPLTLDEVRVVTHQFSISLPLR